MSTNVELESMHPTKFFLGVAVEGDYIKSQTQFSQHYGDFGFYGTLRKLSTAGMYKIKCQNANTFGITGTPVQLPMQVTLTTGWNYVGCPYLQPERLKTGLPDMTFNQDDMIKSQTIFSNYYTGFGWFGNLKFLEPSLGYKMKLTQGALANFNQPAGRRQLVASYAPTPAAIEKAAHGWAVDVGAHADTMTMTAAVTIGGVGQAKGSLAALAGNEIRGSQSVPTTPPFGQYVHASLFQITVYGKQNDTITFRFVQDGVITVLDKSLAFIADDNLGDLKFPVLLAGSASQTQ